MVSDFRLRGELLPLKDLGGVTPPMPIYACQNPRRSGFSEKNLKKIELNESAFVDFLLVLSKKFITFSSNPSV